MNENLISKKYTYSILSKLKINKKNLKIPDLITKIKIYQ